MRLVLRLCAGALACAGIFLAGMSADAAWPDKPVKVVYNYPPGGSADTLSRMYAAELSQKLGQQFVVENRSGASGTIGAEAAARAPADGYTILMTPNSALALLPQLRKTNYAPSDLVPVAPMGEFIYGIAVLPSLGVKTLAEFAALAKASPGKYSYYSPGAGSAGNLRGEAFKILAGIDLLHVPYRGPGEGILDLLDGRLTLMAEHAVFAQAKLGKMVLLAVTSDNRSPLFPEVPTMAEAGYPVNLATWMGVYVPLGTPMEIQQALSGAMNAVSADPKIKTDSVTTGFFPLRGTPAEMATRLKSEIASYGDWIKRTGFRIE